MNEETFNISIRKFLKMVGVNSQRVIEQAVDKALADGVIAGTESFPPTVTFVYHGHNWRDGLAQKDKGCREKPLRSA